MTACCPAPVAPSPARHEGTTLAPHRRMRGASLTQAKAYDAIENVSNTFGYYLDDTMWDQMAAKGSRSMAQGRRARASMSV